MRLLKITGVDLNLFDFDYDLTWAGFFLNADEKIYGRYGGRDASGPDKRISYAGLNHAMRAALERHRQEAKEKPAARTDKPLLADDYPAAQRMRRGECIHCHQVNEFRRDYSKSLGKFNRDDLWVYPLPENLGITLEVDRGSHVQAVAPDSPADRAGLKPGDSLQTVNGYPVASFADVQYGLHRAPVKGQVPISWQRAGKSMTAKLELAEGWRKTNVTWRPSMLDILPALSVYGRDLEAKEKKALGLAEKQLAFQQEKPVHSTVRAVGLQENDIIIGIDDRKLEMTMLEFLGFVRRNYLVGDRITINIIRDGKRLNLPMTLR